ncbi:hypothetical protein [Pseudomarimonas salicorniae]|uniref:DUF4440 domain-containing protein n=1 Tax=Pseudomarimonas salicorniae TaxID=2933270 RepID=A0ABT0GJJ1_9GAMM|nr:hypothetical protein [Lysobacter sp. CAU 1642]MCK7594583.1 hypothetical protein [Lysobacter sp. CAU 1642]
MTRTVHFTLLATVLLLLTACAGGVRKAATPEELIADRAAKRWEAVLAGDWSKAYTYFTPGYRKVVDAKSYEASALARNVKWTGARVTEVRCDAELPDRCVAFVSVDYQIIGGVRGVPELASTQLLRESWLKEDGNWYHLPRRAGR